MRKVLFTKEFKKFRYELDNTEYSKDHSLYELRSQPSRTELLFSFIRRCFSGNLMSPDDLYKYFSDRHEMLMLRKFSDSLELEPTYYNVDVIRVMARTRRFERCTLAQYNWTAFRGYLNLNLNNLQADLHITQDSLF